MSTEDNKSNNQNLWDQFVKLGDMMGDGLHHEPDGKWIGREYKRLSKILVPEIKEAETENRKIKNKAVDGQIKKLLEAIKSKCCTADLKHSRSGSLIVYCSICNKRFKAVKSKK